MQILLGHKANVNICDSIQKTPVMYAAANGHIAAVELLLESGADLNLSDRDGNTALHHACTNVSCWKTFLVKDAASLQVILFL